MSILAWISARLRAVLGLDWIEEARDIAETSRRRQNIIQEQLRGHQGGKQRNVQ